MQTAIELTHVSKAFGKFQAVQDLSFRVPAGTMFGLLGPNGAGKTTSIRMIMNITAPDSGQIQVLGRPMDRETQNRIGYLPEERGLYRKMKVIDHLLFLADIKDVSRETARKRIDGVARQDGAASVADQEGGRAVQGDAAEGAVHRHDRPRSGHPDPRRALLGPGSDQHGADEGILPGVSRRAARRSSSRPTFSSRPRSSATRSA